MSPDAQRIAIAEKCGWTEISEDKFWCLNANYRVHNFCGQEPLDPEKPDHSTYRNIPDYLSDFNAMHEAEKSLNIDQRCRYVEQIEQMVREPENIAFGDRPTKKFKLNHFGRFAVLNATAAQRAEALLRTIGKWVD